jgi:hypothetical protein
MCPTMSVVERNDLDYDRNYYAITTVSYNVLGSKVDVEV